MPDPESMPQAISKRVSWAIEVSWEMASNMNGSAALEGQAVAMATKRETARWIEQKLLAVPYCV